MADSRTGLEWQRSPGIATYTWGDAVAYCDALVLGGHDDWRLPQLQELRVLVDRRSLIGTKHTPAKNFDELITLAGALQSRTEQPRHLYRGQSRVWLSADGMDALIPAFYRDQGGPQSLTALKALIQATAAKLRARKKRYVKLESVAETLLQHYKLPPTRVLDCTQVLHVAASFALYKDWSRDSELRFSTSSTLSAQDSSPSRLSTERTQSWGRRLCPH